MLQMHLLQSATVYSAAELLEPKKETSRSCWELDEKTSIAVMSVSAWSKINLSETPVKQEFVVFVGDVYFGLLHLSLFAVHA